MMTLADLLYRICQLCEICTLCSPDSEGRHAFRRGGWDLTAELTMREKNT
jgi:hypothetical protein